MWKNLVYNSFTSRLIDDVDCKIAREFPLYLTALSTFVMFQVIHNKFSSNN